MNNNLELPCVIIGKQHKERKLLLDKHRGFFVFTDDDRVLGIIKPKEVELYYELNNNPVLLNAMINGYKERIDNYLEEEEDVQQR